MTRCAHGFATGCPDPDCPAGIRGEQLVVAGPADVSYFERASKEVWRERRASGDRVVREWRWVEIRRVPVVGGRSACLIGS